jgi:hypothetical protein
VEQNHLCIRMSHIDKNKKEKVSKAAEMISERKIVNDSLEAQS